MGVTGGFPSQRPVTRSFDVFFDLRLNKQLSKQSRRHICKSTWQGLLITSIVNIGPRRNCWYGTYRNSRRARRKTRNLKRWFLTDIDLFKFNTLYALIGDGHSYRTHVFNLFRHHEHVKSRRCFGSGYFGAAYILHAMIMIILGMIWYFIIVTIFICTPFWNCRHIGIVAIFYLMSYFGFFFTTILVHGCLWNCFVVPFRVRVLNCPPADSIMTSSNGNLFRVTGPLCGEFTGHRWIPRTKASDTELWCFLWTAPEETVE